MRALSLTPISVLYFVRFQPNSSILPQNWPQMYKLIDSTGSIMSSNEFGSHRNNTPLKNITLTLIHGHFPLNLEAHIRRVATNTFSLNAVNANMRIIRIIRVCICMQIPIRIRILYVLLL
jgi:hypothetical protein